MAENFTLEANIITAIKEHLTSTNLLTPAAEVTLLAKALARWIWRHGPESISVRNEYWRRAPRRDFL